MTTMSDATKMAVTLARKGASDDVIALVMETMATHREHIDAARSVAATASPAAREALDSLLIRSPPTDAAQLTLPDAHTAPRIRKDRRVYLYMPLLAAIRQRVSARGVVNASALWLCQQHPAEWDQSRVGKMEPSARGLAGIIAHAIRTNGGVVEGLRFQFDRLDRVDCKPIGATGGGGVAIYRVELA